MFRSMVFSALGVALVVGLFLSAVQTLAVSPIIHAAEVFEVAQPEVVAAHNDGHSHSHDENAWGPEDGFERLSFYGGIQCFVGVWFCDHLIDGHALSP